MVIENLKKILSNFLVSIRVDDIFRSVNKKRLLIVTYHGVCPNDLYIPLFTQISADKFEKQIKFLSKHYNLLSLKDFLICLKEERPFPDRSALITMDDGYMNNYSMAFPILKEYNVPAAIFLTVDFIGTKKKLWFDELFLLLQQALKKGYGLGFIGEQIKGIRLNTELGVLYTELATKLKRMNIEKRKNILQSMRKRLSFNEGRLADNFRMLSWDQVIYMRESGLVDFGVHTANHCILSNIAESEFENEIKKPKEKLSKILGCEILTFCYPNGIPDIDFTDLHEEFIKKCGYKCAFTTGEMLNSYQSNPYRLGRTPAGNDITSDENFFRLNTAGVISIFNRK